MGRGIVNQPGAIESITTTDKYQRCDVCGRQRDVAMVIGTIEGPDPEMGGLSNVLYICTFCCARAIQAVTGFKAVSVLKSWYQMRERHPSLKPDRVHQLRGNEEIADV